MHGVGVESVDIVPVQARQHSGMRMVGPLFVFLNGVDTEE